ncbi:MAG: hypothetical protein HPY52_10655 [Firmicutes bacterium]|nr:hypothetical protein [Bacillota bacterium]
MKLMISCPHPNCNKVIPFEGDFVFALVVNCICGACKLALKKDDDGSVWVGLALPGNTPIRKGDWVILQHTILNIHGPSTRYYTAVEIGFGGKKPKEKNGSPIYMDRVIAIVKEWRKLEVAA